MWSGLPGPPSPRARGAVDIHFLYKVIGLKGAGIWGAMEGQEQVLGGETEAAG